LYVSPSSIASKAAWTFSTKQSYTLLKTCAHLAFAFFPCLVRSITQRAATITWQYFSSSSGGTPPWATFCLARDPRDQAYFCDILYRRAHSFLQLYGRVQNMQRAVFLMSPELQTLLAQHELCVLSSTASAPARCTNTALRSMLALFKLATGTADDTTHEHMAQADPSIANLYFLSFLFVVVRRARCALNSATQLSNIAVAFLHGVPLRHRAQVFILFNILLAIIVDAYQEAAEESRESISIAQDASAALSRLVYQFSALKGNKIVSSERLAQALSHLNSQVNLKLCAFFQLRWLRFAAIVTGCVVQGRAEVSMRDLADLCGVPQDAVEKHPDVMNRGYAERVL
jgi:hypothetical protein